MDFLKNVSIRDKLNRIVMLTTSAALFLATLGFCLNDLVAFRNTETRELSSLADIIGANSTASLQFKDPASGRETLQTLAIDPRVVSAGLYTEDGAIFASYHNNQKSQITLPNQPKKTGIYFENGQILIYRPILLEGKKIGTIFIHSDLQNFLRTPAAIWIYCDSGSGRFPSGSVFAFIQTPENHLLSYSASGPPGQSGFDGKKLWFARSQRQPG